MTRLPPVRAWTLAGTLMLVASYSSSAAAAVIIDDFANPPPPGAFDVTLSAVGPDDVSTDGPLLPGVLGGSRTRTLTYQSGPGNVNHNNSFGNYDYSSTGQSDGASMLEYDGGGSLNFDASTATALSAIMLYADMGISVTAKLTDGDGDMASLTILTGGGPENLDFEMTDFSTANPLLTLSDIDIIKFTMEPPQAGDFGLDLLGFDVAPSSTPVPEPGSIVIWSIIGVVGACYGRRRRKRNDS